MIDKDKLQCCQFFFQIDCNWCYFVFEIEIVYIVYVWLIIMIYLFNLIRKEFVFKNLVDFWGFVYVIFINEVEVVC